MEIVRQSYLPIIAVAEEKNYTVPALEKGMKILEDLAASAEPLSITELADNQGKSRNEIYRMLCSLDSLGYIAREEATKRYSLSLKLYQLANFHPPLQRLHLVARQPLQALADRIQESCHLCVLDGANLSVVSQASGSERIRIHFQLGARFDPLETCSGKLLLRELDAVPRMELLNRSEIWKAAKPMEKKALEVALKADSKQRVLEEDSRLRAGVRDIAVALGTPDTLHASVAVAHLTDRRNGLPVREVRNHLITTAREIEKQLGLCK